MAETAAGLIVAEQVISTTIEGGAIAGVALAQPSNGLKGTWKKIASAPEDGSDDSLARYNHTINVINNQTYLWGGQTSSSSLCDTSMHIISLDSTDPSSHADYRCIPALAAFPDGKVPQPRHSHLSVVQGTDILIFGGYDADGKDVEKGIVWRFNTETLKWRASEHEIGLPHLERLKEVAERAKVLPSKLRVALTPESTPYIVTSTDVWAKTQSANNVSAWHSIPLMPWLQGRTGGLLQLIQAPRGRRYLLYGFGTRTADEETRVFDSLFTCQIESESMSGASVKDTIKAAVGADNGMGSWQIVEVGMRGEGEQGERPLGLAGAASTVVEGMKLVVSGGHGSNGKAKGEVWLLTLK